jgi:hypothetical protein
MTLLMHFFIPAFAFAEDVRFGGWDLRAVEKSEWSWNRVQGERSNGRCGLWMEPAKLAALSIDVGVRCGSTLFAWDVVPQFAWDSEESMRIVPALRLGGVGNLASSAFSRVALTLSYKLAPSTGTIAASVKPGFRVEALRRWMDVFDSYAGAAWMHSLGDGSSGLEFWLMQTLPLEVRVGGIADAASVGAKVVALQWRKRCGAASVSVGVGAADIIVDDLRVLFPFPLLDFSYELGAP